MSRGIHFCAVCGTVLSDKTWPYAACKPCGQRPCHHGNRPAECNDCNIEADLAYDARRNA